MTSLGDLNREWFDSIAATTYNADWIRDLVNQISTFLLDNIQWVSPAGSTGLKVLDYACGGGIVSATLAPFASLLRGIDVSGGMINLYNDNARKQGLSPERMRGVRGDLLADTCAEGDEDLDGPEFTGFDVAVMSMALHHVDDPAKMVKRLADRLAPGGSLVIVDWVSHDRTPVKHHSHPAAHTMTRHGFPEEEMREMFAEAGLVDYGYLLHPEKSTVPGAGQNQLFFARGRTPQA
ncbi:Ubiquinone biosynthesis O-methyltransferase [Madurella mycetomatis]|uniref:Ubiquinone biosynthesis O-methyltransferase n=1 Tax=Madurella mycetomatis TaxID=100816 RepID=A0A175WHB2_9PEZI|nr:Ubiquinone biosynthesis O-methyltransferase [Madurella mycetomatis]